MENWKLSSPHDSRFERLLLHADKNGKLLLADSIRFNRRIETLQHAVADTHGSESIQFKQLDEQIDQLVTDMDETLTDKDAVIIAGWNHYFRLLADQQFIRQRILATFAFSDYKNYELRQELVDGVYGLDAEIIEIALHLYDSSEQSFNQQSELRGVIQERTAEAMINRSQKPSQLALPSSVTDDLLNNSDIDLLRIRKRETSHTRLQVKSSYPPDANTYMKHLSSPVLYIYADDFNNAPKLNTTFPSSRLIIEEIQGTISDEDSLQLDKAQEKLMYKIDNFTAK